MIRSKMRMGILCALLALALHVWPGMVPRAHGQGSRKDDIVFNTRGVPLAGATVRICAMPASGQPCTPLALIYSDAALTQALANPTATDGLGNYNFYAAPGKYMVEISGPGITTKQLPNVILPSDPSSPTFSSLSSTGNISAFSLNLTGNLTVNGNTTVVGNFASGTLNLSNQASPPGTASAGTVNLYTKTTDKRLYYKDDTGVEIGPIASASGAQTNVANTFTAAQNIDADFHTKGPNPTYDVTRYGGYIGPNYAYNQGTTGTMTGGLATLTLASALDFANGHGILVLGAGPAPVIQVPTMVSAAPQQVVGTSTRTYAVVAEDYFGGRVPAVTTATTSTAVATPGMQAATISSCSRTAGVSTCTTTTNHNFQNGAQIDILRNSTGDISFEGTFTLTAVTANTFTWNQYGAGNASGTVAAGSVRAAGRVVVKWNAPTVPYQGVLRNYIYVCTTTCALPANASNFTLVGASVGNDSYFVDAGYAITPANIGNGDVPATIQTAASNQWLSTTIVSGGGTTSVTLANAATNSVVAAKTLHDNTPNILAACAAFANSGGYSVGGTIVIPTASNRLYGFPIASTLNLSSCIGQVEIDFAAPSFLNGTIVVKYLSKLKGLTAGNNGQLPPFYGLQTAAAIYGQAYPLIYMTTGVSHDLSLESLILTGNQPYQSMIYQDQDFNGNGVTSVRYEDVHLAGGPFSTPLVIKGGFGFYWIRGGWRVSSQDFTAPPAALFTTNCGPGTSGAELPYIIFTDHTYTVGSGMVFDSCGAALVGNGGNSDMEFRDMLTESSYVPMARVTGGVYIAAADFYRMSYADYQGGVATPLIDLTNGGSGGMRAIEAQCATGSYQPVYEVGTGTHWSGLEASITSANGCLFGAPTGIFKQLVYNLETHNGIDVTLNNGSKLTVQQILPPAAPQSAVPGGVGAVPSGVTSYAFTALDYDGGETPPGPAITANPNGTQQVVVTAPAAFPAGASGLNLYRNGQLVNVASCVVPQVITPGGTITDSLSYTCGNGYTGFNTTGIMSISQNGITANKFRIATEAWSASPRAEQNVFLPGALTTTWTGSTWVLDKAITVTRVMVQAKTAPVTCSPNATVRVTDGSTPINVTVAAAGNDSGVISQNYAAGATIVTSVQTAAAGCGTSPADANVLIQYRMQ